METRRLRLAGRTSTLGAGILGVGIGVLGGNCLNGTGWPLLILGVVQVGPAGGTAHVTALKTVKPEVSVSVSWWGNIRELREVLALAEGGPTIADPA